jgi:hypothetical protein
MKTLSVSIASLLLLTPAVASAFDVPNSMTETPKAAGAEKARPTAANRVQPGIEANLNVGTGFIDTYIIGFGGRLGYTFGTGIYVGGGFQYYTGHSVSDNTAHATFFGGEVAYKFFVKRRWEIRPYVFGGPGWVTTVDGPPLVKDTSGSFAFQPGVLGGYHFGNAFLYADARYFVTPAPTTPSLSIGGGFGF